MAEFEEMGFLLAPFNFRALQNYVLIHRVLNENGKTVDDLRRFIEHERYRMRKYPPTSTRKCPECGGDMYYWKVNHVPCAMVGGGYKRQWICRQCQHEEYE